VRLPSLHLRYDDLFISAEHAIQNESDLGGSLADSALHIPELRLDLQSSPYAAIIRPHLDSNLINLSRLVGSRT